MIKIGELLKLTDLANSKVATSPIADIREKREDQAVNSLPNRHQIAFLFEQI